jgi:hypothetical protein
VINWNDDKDKWLKTTRGISFQEIADRIAAGDYIDALEHPSRTGQQVFVIRIKDYTWAVPFIIEADETIFLKTVYPSRRLHKRYGGSDEKED